MENIKMIVPKGTTKKRKVLGRGPGTGHGGTAAKGHKGQNARSGGGVRPGFEGGQMPLYRRIARRGFSNHRFKKHYNTINVRDLEVFEAGVTINSDFLAENGLLKKKNLPVKLLGDGEISKKFTVELDKVSKSAKEKIEKAGGEVINKSKTEVGNNG